MVREFQLVCCVISADGKKSSADIAACKIKTIPHWERLIELDGTYIGFIEFEEASTVPESVYAKRYIKNIIKNALDKANVYKKAYVNCSLMVDGLGKSIQFRV